MAATACLRCLSSVGQRRPHVQRYMALKISSRHGAGSLCSGWVFRFSGDDSSNQNDVCSQPEILLFYTITLPEILAVRDSFELVVRLPGRLRCKHSPFTSGRGCSDPPPSRVHRKHEDFSGQWETNPAGNCESRLSHGGWSVEPRRAQAGLCPLLEQDSGHGAS